jgi:L-malate glycosyltransferase
VRRKILVLPSWYPSRTQPHFAPFTQMQAQALGRRHDVRVLYPEPVSWQHILAGKIPPPRYVEEQHGIREDFERAISWLPRNVNYFYPNLLRAARRAFARTIREWGKPDLIHAHVTLPAGWIASQIGCDYSIPVVLTEHSGDFSLLLETPYLRSLTAETLPEMIGIIAVSPVMKKELLAFMPDLKIDVVGNVIPTDFFTLPPIIPPKANVPFRFLCVAGLVPIKGIPLLITAAKLLLAEKVPNFEIVIGGDGPERDHLEAMARSQGVSGICHFLGALSREATRDAMQGCDALVLPSYGETFGVVLAEAMACGKPVISTRCGGPEYVVAPGTGILVTPGQPEELADAMKSFLSGEFSPDPVAIRASVVRRFGEEAFLDQLDTLYQKWLPTVA